MFSGLLQNDRVVPPVGGWELMDVSKILTELREERQQIEEAIISLERLARGRGRRRGRPPSWISELTTKKRGRPPGSKNKVAASSAAAKGAAVA
ncbi:MAG TPA: hypothetical protein VGH38_22800 [Bryobacteraceae bacterium]|jgi:hypothetical protein